MADNGSKANKKRHDKRGRHVEDTFTHPKVIESLFMCEQ